MVPRQRLSRFPCHCKNKGRGELPDATYEDAARLAAHYSSAGSQNKAEVDYVEKNR